MRPAREGGFRVLRRDAAPVSAERVLCERLCRPSAPSWPAEVRRKLQHAGVARQSRAVLQAGQRSVLCADVWGSSLRRIWCIFEIWRCCKLELRLDLRLNRTLSRPTWTLGPLRCTVSLCVSLCSFFPLQVHRGGPADTQIQHSPRLQDPRAGEGLGLLQHQVLREKRSSAGDKQVCMCIPPQLA